MERNIGLKQTDEKRITENLNQLLADEYVLYTKLRKFHWDVTGPNFKSLHELFERQYERVIAFVDDVAERVRQLGAWPLGTLGRFLECTRLEEVPAQIPIANDMVERLVADHEAVIRGMRGYAQEAAEAGDLVTEGFLTDLMTAHEEMAWMLRAHLNAEPPLRTRTGASEPRSAEGGNSGSAHAAYN